MLHKSQDRHKINFSFDFNNKNTKKVIGENLPPPIQFSWIYPQIQLGLSNDFLQFSERWSNNTKKSLTVELWLASRLSVFIGFQKISDLDYY